MSTNATTASQPEDPTAQLLQLVTQQADMLASLQQTLALSALGPSGPSARGAGERITVKDLATKTIAGITTATRRAYVGYIELLADGDPTLVGPDGCPWKGLGDMWADEVLPSHLTAVLAVVSARHTRRKESRAQAREDAGRVVREPDGVGAQFNAIGAWRRMFKVAIDDRHLAEGMNPASKLTKPTRSRGGSRQALGQHHLELTLELMGTTGDDPVLDSLIARTLVVTGARREGLLDLTLGGIDSQECTVLLDEKFGLRVHQPVPDWLISELVEFAASRGVTRRTDHVFVKREGTQFVPITGRRFDYMFADRLQSSYEWADRLGVTAHTLRHTAITAVEREFGEAVAGAFARHKPVGVTGIYTRATREEVAAAVVALFGGDHPWMHREPQLRR